MSIDIPILALIFVGVWGISLALMGR